MLLFPGNPCRSKYSKSILTFLFSFLDRIYGVQEPPHHSVFNPVYFCHYAAISRKTGSVHTYVLLKSILPFLFLYRIYGVQEPASALFSVFNLVSHLVMAFKMWRALGAAKWSCPTFKVWMTYAAISVNAWTWSTVFHTRDVSWTEKADYFCAYSIVLFQLLAFFQRLTCHDKTWARSTVATAAAVAAYAHHIHSMLNFKFDYGYNMKVSASIKIIYIAADFGIKSKCISL